MVQIRLEGKKLVAQYDDGKSETPIDTNYKLGTVFDIKIVAANSKIEVYYNGKKKADIAKSGSSWYFKAGAYSQSNTEKGDKAGAPGKVVIYVLKVLHSDSGQSGDDTSGDDEQQPDGSDDAKPNPSRPDKPDEPDEPAQKASRAPRRPRSPAARCGPPTSSST